MTTPAQINVDLLDTQYKSGSSGVGITPRFQVVVDSLDLGWWKSCKGLSVTFACKEWYEGGIYDAPATILPEQMKYSPIVLERAMTQKDSTTVQQWLSSMADGWMNDRFCTYKGGTATIILADAALQQIAKWDLRGVYPAKWTGPDLDAMGTGAVAMERLELIHSGFL